MSIKPVATWIAALPDKFWLPIALAMLIICGSDAPARADVVADEAKIVEFNRDVRPILSQHCIACHGPDEADREAGLRLDTFEGATEDLGGYAAVNPGDADSSEMILRIESADPDLQMPPSGHGARLSSGETETLRRWIDQGASYQAHWSLVPPIQITPPDIVGSSSQGQSPQGPSHRGHSASAAIDAFILDRCRREGLSMNAPASPAALIRRISLDLTGLPAIAHGHEVSGAISRFVEQSSDENLSQVIDLLLHSPAYAEHWASMWLDIARYADTVGYASDENREIWPWRDWLIQAIASDRSYKQVSIEMLAGDLLPNATDQQILATGFHRNTLSNNEGGTDDEEFRTIAVKDRLSTTINAWMGLTVRCAECHSHKYDPITHVEYYELLDIFNQTADSDKRDDSPKLAVNPPLDPSVTENVNRRMADLDHQSKNSRNELDPLARQRDEPLVKRDTPVRVPVMQRLPAAQQRQTFVMLRGNYRSPGQPVWAAFPSSLQFLDGNADADADADQQSSGKIDSNSMPPRLRLVHWIFSDANPLTARVAVNRYWARLMGIGLVETEEDFGTQGTPPSHPQLLDYLAVDFRQNDWDVRRLLKTIVMSKTYRQSSVADAKSIDVDPKNRLLSRGPRIRLTAEVVRDQALAVSGLLSPKMYGPPVYPPSPIKRVVNAFTGGFTWPTSEGPDRYRRAIYTFLKRSAPHPLFGTFDMSTRDVCSMRRLRTNTPLQSFMTLNDVTFLEAARGLAILSIEQASYREQAFAPEFADHQISFSLRRALGCPPESARTKVLVDLYQTVRATYLDSPAEAREFIGDNFDHSRIAFGGSSQLSDIEASHLASLTVVCNVILNLDEFLNN